MLAAQEDAAAAAWRDLVEVWRDLVEVWRALPRLDTLVNMKMIH